MRFTIDQLAAFLAVARAGGVRRASEELNLSQPAVAARLKALETTLGVELFDRANAMALTKSGADLVGFAEQSLLINDLIQRHVANPEAVERQFRIGVSETIVQSWLPAFISPLREAYPRLSVEIDVDFSRNLRDRLLSNAVDLALLMGPVSDYRVENVALPAFRMAWFRAPSLSAAAPGPGVPVITFARDTRPYRLLKEELLSRYGAGVPLFPSSSLSACFQLVAAGLGVGALPLSIAAPFLESGAIERFDLGWSPNSLDFTASYLATDSSVGARAAEIAQGVAAEYDQNFRS